VTRALPGPSGRGWIPWQALTGITGTAGLPVDGKSAEWDMSPAKWETGEAGSTWASSQWEAGSVADAHMHAYGAGLADPPAVIHQKPGSHSDTGCNVCYNTRIKLLEHTQ
jgi:hypothetical protein